MATQSNNVQLRAYRESAVGTPGTQAVMLEPNAGPDFGNENSLVARDPISKNRMELAGAIVDRDSKFSAEFDLTMEHLQYLAPLAFLADYNGPAEGLADGAPFYPTSVDSTDYVVASGGDLTAGLLIYARGFAVSGNNGLKVVGAASTGTEIKASGLAAETTTAAQNATVEICGVQGAAGDITINADGNIETTALDCTTLGLTDGQVIWIGGATGGALVFATAANRGFARVRGTVTATIIPLDKTVGGTWAADNGATKTIQIFFGRFLRNVAVDNADFAKHTTSFELEWPELDGGTKYEVSEGNLCDELKLNFPISAKATMNCSFVGTDTLDISGSQLSGGSTARAVVQDDLFNDSSQMVRVRSTQYDETALTTYFKNCSVSFKNNASALKVLGSLGAIDINYGTFMVGVEAQAVFTEPDLLTAINDSTVVTMEIAMRNADGGFFLDLPSVQFGGGKRDLPKNEEVLVNLAGKAVKDGTLGYAASISLFPWLPE